MKITTRNELTKLGAYSVVQDSQRKVFQLVPADRTNWARWLTPGESTEFTYADISLPAVLLAPKEVKRRYGPDKEIS
jgi:hypothetical protein